MYNLHNQDRKLNLHLLSNPQFKTDRLAFYISSTFSSQVCQLPTGATTVCNAFEDTQFTAYSSQKTVCSSEPLNLTGIVQLFVSSSLWSTSGSCQGDPTSVEAVMADAGMNNNFNMMPIYHGIYISNKRACD
jgi:hypothetical protein